MGMKDEPRLKNLVESQQLTKTIISDLFKSADVLRKEKYEPALAGKILATLFYEPSTRTRFSFESAMLRLGGSCITTENAKEFSSAVKGETLADTIRVVSVYSDCILLRHYEDGAAARAVKVSTVPIINAGDGRGQHPTQALLDIYTINREIGRLNDFRIAMVGDLANGRTVRSLCYLLGRYTGVEIIFISPEELKIKEDIKDYLRERGTRFSERTDMSEVLPFADIIYMTRIQKERMKPEEYDRTNDLYVLDSSNLKLIKTTARIMHPLPHVNELNFPLEIEQKDDRIAYFRQAENGLYIRMAILEYLLQSE